MKTIEEIAKKNKNELTFIDKIRLNVEYYKLINNPFLHYAKKYRNTHQEIASIHIT